MNNDTPLSGFEMNQISLKEFQKKANIVIDSNLDASTRLEDIFRQRGHAVIFHRWPGQEIGHYCCMIRRGTVGRTDWVLYFDSFGNDPYFPLYEICKREGVELYINDIKYQNDKRMNCGRYALFLVDLNKNSLDPYQIENFLQDIGNLDKFLIQYVR